MQRTPLIWFGGKSRLVKTIYRYMPPHKCFVDLFGGGASVTTGKPPSFSEVFNDIDSELINFLLQLRRDPVRLANELDSLPYARELYNNWKREEMPTDKFEAAIRWFYLNRSGVVCGNKYKSGWRHGGTVNPAKDYHTSVAMLQEFATRFRNVQIENRDFREIIRTYDSPDTLFYCDPPYIGNERRYKGGFTRDDHIALADRLESIQGRAIVSYYEDALVDHLYGGGWRRVEISTFTTSQVIRSGEREPRMELLLLSWDDPQLSLLDWPSEEMEFDSEGEIPE